MASATLSLFPSPVCSIPSKSCLRKAEDIRTRRSTTSPVLDSKQCPSRKLRGLALKVTPQVNRSTPAQSPESNPRPSFSSPLSALSTDSSFLSSTSPSRPLAAPKVRAPAAIRKMSIDTTSSDNRSDFSGSTLVRTNSGSSSQPKVTSPPIKSIFPEYDSSLPLSQQRYYPTETLPRPSLERRAEYHGQTLADIPSPTTPVPAAGLSQLQALWNAASGQSGMFHSEMIKLDMQRDTIGADAKSTELRFGSREGRTLYSVSAADVSSELSVRRHHPARTGIVPVAQVDIAMLEREPKHDTTIFPQQAAVAALEAAATTHRANTIAQYDPRATSPQAAQLAFDAVAEAKAHESCQLVRVSQGVNRFGTEEYGYELRHPRSGTFNITIDGTFDFTSKSNARIALHQPFLAEKASSKPFELVCIDLGRGTLDIDVASFRQLQSKYMIDSAICAVLAVAFTENKVVQTRAKAETFAGPPLSGKKDLEILEKKRESRWRRGVGKKRQKEKAETEKLPGLTRGMLYLLGFSFEAVVWLLGLGVKVLSKVIVCASGVFSKK